MGMWVYADLVAPLAVSAELALPALACMLALTAVGVGIWRVFGKAPRRNRAYRRARELLGKGDWQAALSSVHEIRALGVASAEGAGRVDHLEGEVQRTAADSALAAGNYDEALAQYAAAAKLLGLNPEEATAKVVERMLAELRQFVVRNEDDNAIAQARRILEIRSTCAEANFWLGLVSIRQSQKLASAH